jgi:hypothetical protein
VNRPDSAARNIRKETWPGRAVSMPAVKKLARRPASSEDPRSPLGRLCFTPDGRPRIWLAYLGLAAALAAGGYAAWRHAGPVISESPEYRLTPERVELVPAPPAWIRSDVRGEALRVGRLDTPQRLLAPDLTERAYQAFAVHPWIARVTRVSKGHPAWLRVEVEYRRPVAMVQVGERLLPVAADAVVLPHEDFSPVDARGYPRVEGIDTLPAGPPGAPWGDARVLGAAQIAAAVGDRWKPLNLERIRPSRSHEPSAMVFELLTPADTAVYWGHPPGLTAEGEPSAERKLELLEKYVATHGPLDRAGPSALFDVTLDQPLAPPSGK